MTDFLLYNTMTRTVAPFGPADGRTVHMYTCGPTVYKPAHLGNFRTFVFEDLLRRSLRLRGWGVQQAMNLTDVEDKIIKGAADQGTTIDAITTPVIETFHADRRYLKIEDAEHYPRATSYIPEMIRLVERLVARGLAYQAADRSVYFAIARYPQYGRLSRLDTREIKAGARVSQDDYSKENASDFALWKAAKPEDERTGAAWDSPWGRGRPGWHLECSAMALSLFGDTLDLHCGGVDLIFPHHEDEIAQSEGATGVTFARCWCHGEFLLTDGTKMAKRVGNVMTVADLRAQRISAAAVRHLMATAHYRQKLNLSEAAIDASERAVARIGELADRLASTTTNGATPAMIPAVDDLKSRMQNALFDDLNAPEALAAVFDFVRAANADLDRRGQDKESLDRARQAVAFIEETLGIVPPRSEGGTIGAPIATVSAPGVAAASPKEADTDEAALRLWVEDRLKARAEARARRDFAQADGIRDELAARGVTIADTGAGTTWKLGRPSRDS
jgi:cysteinyl-tRNA synthetase